MDNLNNLEADFEIVLRDVFGSNEYTPAPNHFITDDHVGMCLFGALGYNKMERPEHFYTSELVNTCIELQLERQYSGSLVEGWNDSFFGDDSGDWYEGEAKQAYYIGHSLGKKMQEEFGSHLYEDGGEGIGF